MSALNKLILVNSLDSTYQEFDFAGHAHFSGGNGQGKSTLLRSILFAYSGEVESLGNDWQKILFPATNSALIFQFGEGKKAFTVCAIKPQASLEIILVKGLFEKEIFLSSKKIHSRSEIVKAIKKRKLDFIEKIDSGEFYRSIIYGHQNGKNSALYRKFTLAKLPHPDLIYHAQEDLFGDKSLNIASLKEQIGDILIDEKQQINLAEIRLKLTDFVKHWDEINSYYQQIDLVPEIELKRSQIENRKMQIATLGSALNNAFEQGKATKSAIEKELKKIEKKQSEGQKNQTKSEAEYFNQLETLFEAKTNFSYLISQAKRKQESYQKIELQDLKSSTVLLPFLYERKVELQQIVDQKSNGKKAKSKEEISKKTLSLEIQLQEKELENKWISEREKYLLIALSERKKLELAADGNIDSLTEKIDEIESTIVSLKNQEYQLRKDVLSEVGGKGNLVRLNQLEEEYYRLCIEEERSQQRLVSFRNKQEIESESIIRQENDSKIKFKSGISNKEKEIEEVKSQIANMRGSFQGWLEKNYPDWEKTIGKICKKEVLLNPYLGPDIERLNELFFGIKLDLDEVDSDISTVHDLQNILTELENDLEGFTQQSIEEEAKWEKKKVNLEKRFRQKIRQEENEIKKLNYEIEQVKIRLRQQKHKKENSLQKLVQETEQKAIGLGYEIVKLNTKKEELQNQLLVIKSKLKESIQLSTLSLEKKLEKAEKEYDKTLKKIRANIKVSEQKLENLLAPIDLKASPTKLRISLFEIEDAIQKAHQDRDLLKQYHKDENEYFSNLETWESQLKLIEGQISDFRQRRILNLESEEREESELQKTIERLSKDLEDLKSSQTRYKVYQKRAFYQAYKSSFNLDFEENQESIDELLAQMQELESLIFRDYQGLKNCIHQFTIGLNDDNILGFSTKFKNEEAYLQFASSLAQFIEAGEVSKAEADLAARYANLIDDINLSVRQVSGLEEKLQDGVGELSELLNSFSYSGNLKAIRLEAQPSDSPLIHVFKKINEFAQNNVNQLGEGNLFNQAGNQSKNQEAIELLKDLNRHLWKVNSEKLPSKMLFELTGNLESQQGIVEIDEYGQSFLSNGAKRLVDCILRISLIRLALTKSEGFEEIGIQALIDNVNELDSSQLAGMITWLKKLNIDLVSASVDTPSLMDINHGYRLTRNAEAKIKSYQIFSKVG